MYLGVVVALTKRVIIILLFALDLFACLRVSSFDMFKT
jgi:hypothetical protein